MIRCWPQSACLVLLTLPVLLVLPADAGAGNSIRLHDQSGSIGPEIRLSDVAELSGPHAQALAELVVGRFTPNAQRTTVSLAAVRKTLAEQRVNFAAMSLGGHSRCDVTKLLPPPPLIEAHTPAPLVANSIDEFAVHWAPTMREHLVDWLQQYVGVPANELEVRLTPDEVKVLNVSAKGDRFEFQPGGNARLGKLAINIRQYHLDDLIATHHIRPIVTRRASVVVLTDTVKAGETLTHDNVEVRQVMLDRERGVPVRALADALGMVARSRLKSGAIIYESGIRRPLLVHKGQIMTIRCISGGFVFTMVVRAEADGSLNDVIKVRNERTQRSERRAGHPIPDPTFFVRVTGERQGMIGDRALHNPTVETLGATQSITRG